MSNFLIHRFTIFGFIVLGTLSSAKTQNGSLSEELWNRIQDCYSMFEDFDEDGKLDFETLVDDSKNGYIEVSGSYPTCGCSCTDIVGAFKGLDGSYTFIEEELWSCSWIHSIKTNRSLMSVFPNDFGIKSFAPSASDVSPYAFFYLDIDIPRVGTDTKISIELIPFGMYIKHNQTLCFGIDESKCENSCVSLSEIISIAEQVKSDQTLDYLSQGNYNSIINEDKATIEKIISNENRDIKNIDDLMKYIRDLKERYEFYKKIEYKNMVLGWDKAEKKFYIKSKGAAEEDKGFRDFLVHHSYWGLVC